MFSFSPIYAPTQPVHDPFLDSRGISLWIKREDLIHPIISGNKWRKLKYNIEACFHQQKNTLLTFGGAYSNHIAATAYAGHLFGLKTVGIIRGDELHSHSNDTLRFATQHGMELQFVSRATYRQKTNEDYLQNLTQLWGSCFVIPEGGDNQLAIKGCGEIVPDIPIPFDYVMCACGTGTTFSGIVHSLNPSQQALGIVVLKGATYLDKHIADQVNDDTKRYQIFHQFHAGGYAKLTPELISFIHQFEERTQLILDPIYTGKLLFAIYQLIEQGYFTKGTTIVAIHTGGLQGRNGMKEFMNKPL